MQLYCKDDFEPTSGFTSIQVFEEERQILRLADRIHEKRSSISKNGVMPSNLNEEQNAAFEKIRTGKSLACIEGLAGTGKSHLLVALKNYYESLGYKVRAFGPDNATVKVLKEKGFVDSCNIHQFLFKNHYTEKYNKNIINTGEVVGGYWTRFIER